MRDYPTLHLDTNFINEHEKLSNLLVILVTVEFSTMSTTHTLK